MFWCFFFVVSAEAYAQWVLEDYVEVRAPRAKALQTVRGYADALWRLA